jgi:hypothetical protein
LTVFRHRRFDVAGINGEIWRRWIKLEVSMPTQSRCLSCLRRSTQKGSLTMRGKLSVGGSNSWFLLLVLSCLTICGPALADKRVALVIGNGAYVNARPLPNPPNDAQDVAAALKRSGFETILGMDLDKAAMDEIEIRFSRVARDADVAVFYYSGHAMQINGINYLAPIDTKLVDAADLRRMERVDDIVADLQQARNLRILVLDSCRDNPLAEELKRSLGNTRGFSIQRGLAKIDNPQGMIISYATQAGRTADDGAGRNSPYTAAFLKNVEQPGEIGAIFRRISTDVYAATGQTQLPELSLSVIGEYYLNGSANAGGPMPTPYSPPPMPVPADPCAVAEAHWHSAEAIGTALAYQDHLARFAGCAFAGLARAKIAALQQPQSQLPPPGPIRPPLASGLIFPDSDRRRLTRDELQGLSLAQLRIARNEIFARKGRFFRDPQLAAYFARFSWYKPYSYDVSLNAIEQANTSLIQSMEH